MWFFDTNAKSEFKRFPKGILRALLFIRKSDGDLGRKSLKYSEIVDSTSLDICRTSWMISLKGKTYVDAINLKLHNYMHNRKVFKLPRRNNSRSINIINWEEQTSIVEEREFVRLLNKNFV